MEDSGGTEPCSTCLAAAGPEGLKVSLLFERASDLNLTEVTEKSAKNALT